MLERSYDWVCLGENLYSLVFSLGALSNNKTTTILKDQRFAGTPADQMMVDHLFVELLQHWGREQLVAPLSEMGRELSFKRIHLLVNDTQLRLGASPAENFIELARKLPFLFSSQSMQHIAQLQEGPEAQEQFNREILEAVSRLARHLYHYRSMQSLNIQEMMALFPLTLRQWIEEVYQWGQSPQVVLTPHWWMWKSFVYIISAHFRSRATLNLSYAEMAYLLIQCLLPIYGLKGNGLVEGLRQDFIQRGGVVRQTDIIDWHFENGRLWGLELSSYEGVVHPKDVFIFSDHLPSSCPLTLLQRQDALRCVGLELAYPQTAPADAIMGVAADELANECPFWKLSFSPGKVSILLFVKQRAGQLASLYSQQFALLLQRLRPTLLWPCQLPAEQELRASLSFRSELFERPLHWENWRHAQRDFPRFMPARLCHMDPQTQELKSAAGVWYMGPHLGRFLGPVGTPLEMKEFLFSSKAREKVASSGRREQTAGQ